MLSISSAMSCTEGSNPSLSARQWAAENSRSSELANFGHFSGFLPQTGTQRTDCVAAAGSNPALFSQPEIRLSNFQATLTDGMGTAYRTHFRL
jgi:hypothetical protein